MGSLAFCVLIAAWVIGVATHTLTPPPVKLEVRNETPSRLFNIHVSSAELLTDPLTISYGPCHSIDNKDAHYTIAKVQLPNQKTHTSRLVWALPEDAKPAGCLSAWGNGGGLYGRSEPQFLTRRRKRAAIPMTDANGIDVRGPWFDGVALLKDKQPELVDVAAAKAKSVAIVGAGMAGLMTYLILSQAGLANISIIESTNRLGGRIRTEYLSGGPFEYSYQEMGPMRFPATYTDPETMETVNISDHQMVFALAEEMNKLNSGNKNLSVDFIPWIQWNSNGLVYRNGFKLETGLPPTVAQIEADPSLAPPMVVDEDTQKLQETAVSFLPNASFNLEMAKNMFKAHKEWLENGLGGLGGDLWSESAFMINYLNGSLNSTDMLVGYRVADSFWEYLTTIMYFSAASFKTIDGGLNRLPLSFQPHVKDNITYNRKIERVTFNTSTNQLSLHWRNHFTDQTFQTSAHDYAIISAPFSIVRKWRLPPLPTTLRNAIQNLPYSSGCKVALEYRTRFWEHYPTPIYGGCSTTTDIWGIGEICYPSYNLNSTGPASILASWAPLDWGERWVSVSEEEHVAYVLDAMFEIHGEVAREEYTGKYKRKCWLLEEVGGWAHPSVGQHQLYMPEYFKTHNNMIFIGEHTSYTHAWIASALESGIRGGVQLLLELGLVDEAKEAVHKWMARWIDI